jgi:hypothetical protein
MRIVKRNSAELRFLQHRELFRFRLLARGYSQKFIGEAFSTMAYADMHKFLYERHLAAKEKESTATNENIAPALIALPCLTRREPTHWGLRRPFFSQIGVFDGRGHSARSYTDGNFFTRSKIGIETRQPSTGLPIPEIKYAPPGY